MNWTDKVKETVKRCEAMIAGPDTTIERGDFGSGKWAGYAARAAEGTVIPGRISAKTEVEFLAREIRKAMKREEPGAWEGMKLLNAESDRLFPVVEEEES